MNQASRETSPKRSRMTREWQVAQLGDCARLIGKTTLPPFPHNTPYIGLEHIEENTLSLTAHGTGSDVKSAKKSFSKGDILFGKLRPYFRKVIQAPFDGICSTDIWVVRATEGVDQGFLYYCMASQSFVDFVTSASEGTRMPRGKWEYASQFELAIPSLVTQRAIAHILGTLDEKIELNRRINETLEAMAQAIFKDWFVNFGPTRAKMEGGEPYLPPELWALFPDHLVNSDLGDIPEGWEVGVLDDIIELLSGGTPKTSVLEYWNGDIPWYTAKDAPNPSDVFVLATERTITQAGIDNSAARILPVRTTVISARGTVGRLACLGVPMAMNQTCYAIRGTHGHPEFFTYWNVRTAVGKLKQRTHGTIFDTITRQSFKHVETAIPPVELAKEFDSVIGWLMERILNNLHESQALTGLRDALLPRLVSGTLRVL